MPDYEPGFEIAGYRIEQVLGHGGMAVVYRAEDTRLGRKVALKLMTTPLTDSQQFRQRFIRESRLAASLDHPNIVPIYEAGEAEGQLFIAMRYVVGGDLKVLLTQHPGGLPLPLTLRLFTQIADALDAAHERGLVHRDVKPGNMLISSGREQPGHHSNHVYLTDFGLTKRTSSLSEGLTGTGHFLGTVDYVSPEQIQGKPVEATTDVYAMGCVLHECLTGQLPFHRDDDAAVLWAHLVAMPPPVSGLRPDLPPELNAITARAMAKMPEDRYASCGELVRDLQAALDLDYPLTRPGQHARGASVADQGSSDATSADSRLTSTASPAPGQTGGGSQHPSFPPGSLQPFGAGVPHAQRAPSERPAPSDEESLVDEAESPWDDEVDSQASDTADAGADVDSWDEDASWEGDEDEITDEAEEAEAQEGTQGRRRRLLVGLVAGVAVLVAVAVALLVLRPFEREETFQRYSSTNAIVPFSLEHPSSWSAQEGTDTAVVFSPRNDALGALFLPGPAGSWTGTHELLLSNPSDAVGLYAYSLSTQYGGSSSTVLQDAVQGLLPPKVTVSSTTQQAPDTAGANTTRLDAEFTDPSDPNARLQSLIYVSQPPAGGSVLFVFFAAPEKFDGQRPTIDRVMESVTW
jgi:serine/threonine protein kinase